MQDIWAVNNTGGDTPADKQSTAKAAIFTLHQQSAFHIKGRAPPLSAACIINSPNILHLLGLRRRFIRGNLRFRIH